MRGRVAATTVATLSGCWYLLIVEMTFVPPESSYEMVLCHGTNTTTTKPSKNPAHPRTASTTNLHRDLNASAVSKPLSIPTKAPAKA